MTLLINEGSTETSISSEELDSHMQSFIKNYQNKLNKILIIPPDFTRFHSKAGDITVALYKQLKDISTIDILPALGTHVKMSAQELDKMFPGIPHLHFKEHNWRNDIEDIGVIPAEFINKITEGKLNYSIQAQLNKIMVHGKYDLIISIGQVVPHEVVGMANHNKNIFVGIGGKDIINKSHFIGAVHGMEQIMGKENSPVRQIFDYAEEHFAKQFPITYIQTVLNKNEKGELTLRGLYAGEGKEPFSTACKLAVKTNLDLIDKPFNKVVVYLDPSEFKSTWLGNKAIYRTRMAMADGGDLIILAPGLKEFGEDKEIDRLIRKYGYFGTPSTLKACDENDELRNNYSAAAHLIHGSSEDRFNITYCPGHLTKEEIESVNFQYADLNETQKKYNPKELKDGFNIVEDEEIFYISNPALGLWALKEKF
ncbi:MAG: D-mannonate epimerase [Planctomycetota bacterium]|nr:MAG: D-mannonate epimerase [Planctomycetota bacterium]